MQAHRSSSLLVLSLCGLAIWLLVSLACGLGAPPLEVRATLAPGGERPLLETPAAPEAQEAPLPPAILEARRLILEWPPTIRVGDSDVVRLRLELDQGGEVQVTAEFPGHETRSETVEIPDLYDTHNVFAEARLEMAGVQVAPNDLVSQPLLRGQAVTFYWSVQPQQVGTFRGALWFYLRFAPLDGGPQTQRPITVQPIEIRAVNLLGLSGAPARLLGAVGTLAGSIFGLDNVLPWAWKLFRRKKDGNR